MKALRPDKMSEPFRGYGLQMRLLVMAYPKGDSPSIYYHMQGEYYNQDEVQAMVTAEVLEEEKKKREEADEIEAEMAEAAAAYRAVEKNSAGQKKKRRRGPMVAA
jgi:hypothetical protein